MFSEIEIEAKPFRTPLSGDPKGEPLDSRALDEATLHPLGQTLGLDSPPLSDLHRVVAAC